jgi:hypothetical protein
MVGVLKVAEEIAARGESAILVTLFPDNASKYLSAHADIYTGEPRLKK